MLYFAGMKCALLFCFFILTMLTGWVYAQSPKVDSLKRVIASARTDTLRVSALAGLALELSALNQVKESISTAEKALDLAEKTGDPVYKMRALRATGYVYRDRGLFPQALDFLTKGLEISRRTGNKSEEGKMLHAITEIYYRSGNNVKSIETAQQLIRLSKQIQGKEAKSLEILAMNSLGGIYMNLKQYNKAHDAYSKALRFALEIGDQGMESALYLNLSASSYYLKDIKGCLAFMQKGRTLSEKRNDYRTLANILNNIGSVYDDIPEKKDSVLYYFLKGLEIRQRYTDEQSGIIYNLRTIGEYYTQRKDFSNAIPYLQKAYDASLKFDNYQVRYQSALALADVHSIAGNYKSAYKFQKEAAVYRDSVVSSDKTKAIGKLDAQFHFDRENERKEKQAQIEAERRRNFYYLFGGMFGIVLLGAGLLYYRYRSKAKHNQVLSYKNEMITAQKVELENAYEEINATLEQVQHQKEEIENKNRKIEDSIRYAYQIQTAILPDSDHLKAVLPRHFIFYQPKDIVSGDFYWVSRRDDKIFFCVADCTGHGVPGAFMSVVGSNALHNAINELGYSEPDVILTESDRSLRRTLRQESTSESKDGMDVALCILYDNVLLFAGAGRPLYHLREGILTEIKGDKFPIGGGQHEHKTFTCHQINLQKGDRIYIFSDGITDQFGGTQKRKFTPKRLQEFIIDNAELSLEAQGAVFQQTMNEWMTGHSQLDDLTLIALEV